MAAININKMLWFRIGVLMLFVLFFVLFPSLVLDVFLAFILTLIGRPLAEKICKIKLFKRHMPMGISAGIVTIFILLVLCAMVWMFVPLLGRELKTIGNLNYEYLAANMNIMLDNIQKFLYDYDVIERDTTLVTLVTNKLREILNINMVTDLLSNIVNSAGSLIFRLFTIFFVTFFFIKDDFRLDKSFRFFFSESYTDRLKRVSDKINSLLSRYLSGTLLRTVLMLIMLYVGLLLFGVKGAFLMAFMGAVINIIPYLGPVIGCLIACVLGTVNCLSMEMYTDILPVILKIVGVFVGANVIDNVLLQPMIYSQSVKAHPVEIFLVTIIGGIIAGIGGMILCIPVYTILRVIAIEIYNYVEDSKTDKVVTDGT